MKKFLGSILTFAILWVAFFQEQDPSSRMNITIVNKELDRKSSAKPLNQLENPSELSGLNVLGTSTEGGSSQDTASHKRKLEELSQTIYSEMDLMKMGLSFAALDDIKLKLGEKNDSFKYGSIHWIDLLGFNDGEPVFEIISLVDFTERSLKTVEKAFNYELNEFQQDNQWGDFNPDNESKLIEILENEFGDDRKSQINIVNCRALKCLVSLSLGEDENWDVTSLNKSIRSYLKNSAGQNVKCTYKQEPGFKESFFLTYSCLPIKEVEGNN